MRLAARSDQEAAHKVGVHPSTVSRWSNKADLDRAVNLLLQDVVEATVLILKQAAPDAARALAESLRDPKSRVSAATAILDRTGFAARQAVELTGKDGGPIEVADARSALVARLAAQAERSRATGNTGRSESGTSDDATV